MEVCAAKGQSAVSLASTLRVSFLNTISGQTFLLCVCYRGQCCASKILILGELVQDSVLTYTVPVKCRQRLDENRWAPGDWKMDPLGNSSRK